MSWPLLLGTIVAFALGACGAREPLPSGCLDAEPSDVLRALRHAPHDVVLPGGAPISTCVGRAISEAELQVVGATLTVAADDLVRRLAESDGVAFQLGFLMGAVERGAARTAGVQSELSLRIGQAAGLDGGPQTRRGALLRGRAAGRRSG